MSEAAERAPVDAGEIVRAAARAFERDRYLAALLAPREVRDDLIALAAFAGEVARIPGFVTEPMIGEIRLQWWRDTVAAGLASGLATGHPIADAVCAAARRHSLPSAELLALVDAQSERLDDIPFADLAALLGNLARWDGGLFRLAWRIAGGNGAAPSDVLERVLSEAGEAYGMARCLLEAPAERAQGRCLLPRDRLAANAITHATLRTPAAEAGLDTVAATLAQEVHVLLSRVSAAYQEAPRAARMAALPIALVRPYLRLSQRIGVAAPMASDIGPLTRVWRLWMTSLSGRP